MRGKLEQPRGLIELLMVELERIDLEYREFWLSYEYTCPGGQYKSAMGLPVTNSRDMTNSFFRELLNEAKKLSELDSDEDHGVGFSIANKATTVLPIKNICQRVKDVIDAQDIPDESMAYIDLSTSGFHFKEPEHSLSSKDFDERFKIFMGRARDKMGQGYYTLAADDLEKAKILCSTSPLLYKLTGICHRELGHFELAQEMFEKALELGDGEEDTYLYLAEVSFFLNDMKHACRILGQMLEKYPENIRAMVELANARYQLDADFADILDRAYELNADDCQHAIRQTFVFKKVDQAERDPLAIEDASSMLGIPAKTITQLAARHRIPARTYTDSIVLDKDELRSWAFVYRRYNLLDDEVNRVSPEANPDMALLS